jgi:protein O-GlcNAc transferase
MPARVTARADARRHRLGAHQRSFGVARASSSGWLEQLDGARFDVRLFHLGTANDLETARAKTLVDALRLRQERPRRMDAAHPRHQLDVLIYPEIGMDPMTAKLASLRLAPVQATSWGHPQTSGLPTMDYFLSAEALEPPGAGAHYTERLVTLPGFGSPCIPTGVKPGAVDLASLGLRPDVPLLLCPGTPFKYTPRHDAVFVEIARRLGECQFVFFTPKPPELMQRLRARMAGAFERAGLEFGAYAPSCPG